MKKIVGLVAVAALTLAACTSGPTATETGVPTPSSSAVESSAAPSDSDGGDVAAATVCDPAWWATPGNKEKVLNGTVGSVVASDPVVEDPNFNFRYHKVLYVGTLANATDKVPVCGTIYEPKGGWTSGKMVAWTHGTVGLRYECQPSHKVASLAQEPEAGGIGTTLTSMMQAGHLVVATDYYSGLAPDVFKYQPYANGMIEGRNTLEMIVAAGSIISKPDTVGTVDYAVWGHSQGGGAALWAGQLSGGRSNYIKAIGGDKYRLKTVVGAAPATQFVYGKTNTSYFDDSRGYSLGDRNEYNWIQIPNVSASGDWIPIGDVLFSYVAVPTAALSQRMISNSMFDGKFAALPKTSQALDLTAMLDSDTGADKIGTRVAADFCINKNDTRSIEAITLLLNKFNRDLTAPKQFFANPWAGDFTKTPAKNATPGIDRTCKSAGLSNTANGLWCQTLWYLMPGPNAAAMGASDPAPVRGEGVNLTPVPVLVTQGTADDIVWCYQPGSTSPLARNCLAQQYTEQIKSQVANAYPLTTKFYATYDHKGKTVQVDHFGVMGAGLSDMTGFINKNL